MGCCFFGCFFFGRGIDTGLRDAMRKATVWSCKLSFVTFVFQVLRIGILNWKYVCNVNVQCYGVLETVRSRIEWLAHGQILVLPLHYPTRTPQSQWFQAFCPEAKCARLTPKKREDCVFYEVIKQVRIS